MSSPEILALSATRRIAYHRLSADGDGAKLPGVIFLGGFRSDMTGTKARNIEDWARREGRGFVRFDYRGHGASSAAFRDGSIGDWAEDAGEVLGQLTEGPQILVGSSMGGWIALLLALRFTERVAGLGGIAAAPDFTEDGIWQKLGEEQRQALSEEGEIVVPSDYDPEGYPITHRLIVEGRRHLVLRSPLSLGCPVRLMHGTADKDVPMAVALRLLDHLEAKDARLVLVKDGDHRLSDPAALGLLTDLVDEVSKTS